MKLRLGLLPLLLLLPFASQATRPEFWDFEWFVNISTICRAQSDKYDDAPVARFVALEAALGPAHKEAKACLRQVTAMPDYVCAEVMRLDLEQIEKHGRALREKFELESIEFEDLIQYVATSRSADPRFARPPCSAKLVASNRWTQAEPLDESMAACRGDPKTDPKIYDVRDDPGTLAALTERAEAGDAIAQTLVGRRYGLGIGGAKRDSVASVNWYRRAADQGFALAQANLAYMYLHGEGVERDFELARLWARRAADQGHAIGQIHLGHLYEEGKGVPQDARQAERCYLVAAKQGLATAQQLLVRLYARGGIGVPADRARANLWLQRVRDGRRSGKPWQAD